MIVEYKTFLRDINELTYRDNPDCRPIKQLLFDSDDISSLNDNLPHILMAFRGNAFVYGIILVLYSLYEYDNDIVLTHSWTLIYYMYQIRHDNYITMHDFNDWMMERLEKDNGDLSNFIREYNRYKLTHPLSFDD